MLLVLLTSQRALPWWGVLSDKRKELIFGLFQGDFTVLYSLGQSGLKHNNTEVILLLMQTL